ncbi:MAG TPA: hypothetical protein VG448_07210 [Solirubrobacterales bacterium]|nr:hypothetical protein [Solirubrobacterales bacterium]
MTLPATAKWVLLALLGVAIAIGVAIAAANLTSQQIGIANESVSAGDRLAPALSVPGERTPTGPSHDHGPEEEPSTTFEPPETVEEEPVQPEVVEPESENGDDSGGHGSDGDD